MCIYFKCQVRLHFESLGAALQLRTDGRAGLVENSGPLRSAGLRREQLALNPKAQTHASWVFSGKPQTFGMMPIDGVTAVSCIP